MNRSANRPVTIISAATATALACALGLHWLNGADVALAASSKVPSVAMAPDGHYWATAVVEGREMRMLVDTGASVVTLGLADAEKAGLSVSRHDFTQTLQTASGPIKAAPVMISSIMVGGVRLKSVEALVVDADLPAPLLGMSYLGRLSGFEAREQGLIFKG